MGVLLCIISGENNLLCLLSSIWIKCQIPLVWTASKVSVFGVVLVRIFLRSDAQHCIFNSSVKFLFTSVVNGLKFEPFFIMRRKVDLDIPIVYETP